MLMFSEFGSITRKCGLNRYQANFNIKIKTSALFSKILLLYFRVRVR